MRDLTITRENLATLSEPQRENLKRAIAEAYSIERNARENLPHNKKIDNEYFWAVAKNIAVKKVPGTLTDSNVLPFFQKVQAETFKARQDNDYFTAENVLRNVFRFGPQVAKVGNDFVTPWPLEDVMRSIEVERPEKPRRQSARPAAAAAA